MSKVYTGTTTNNVTELTLQEEGVGNIGTQTIVWDSTQGTIDQVIGAIPDNWKNGDGSLKQLQIGSSCTTIGSNAFGYCQSLTGSLIIPDSVTSIGVYAFGFCTGLTGSLTIGNSVTSIENSAFYSCTGLTGSLTIGNSVTSIGSNSFDSCSNLTSIAIPESVASIGSYAFYYCSNAAIYTNCPASSWVGTGACSGITNIYLGPNAVGTGYTNNWQAGFGSGPTVSTWTNYPNIP